MNHLSLFSGIGGIDLAAEWAGFQPVAFCEIDLFCQKVLAKHWPDVPIEKDIFNVSATSLERRGIDLAQIKAIVGGYPCQPDSFAGKRLGKEDDRYLWPEMFRLVKEIQPDWVLGENVVGHVSMGLPGVLSDLESADYETGTVIIPAAGVGAWHIRERVFVIAHSNKVTGSASGPKDAQQETRATKATSSRGAVLAYPDRQSLAVGESIRGNSEQEQQTSKRSDNRNGWEWWATEPGICRVADGVSDRVDRLQALGNAVVPQQVYPILKAIADYECGN